MNKKTDERNATIKGAAVGAAIGVGLGAAATVLADKKNRTKLIKKSEELKDDAVKSLKNGKQEINKLRTSLKKNIDDALPEAKRTEAKVKKKAATSTSKKVSSTTKGK